MKKMYDEKHIKIIRDHFDINKGDCETILQKAIDGEEVTNFASIDDWLNSRFIPNCVAIDKNGYANMCIDALKILNKTAPTDFGSSRQRDLGQLWADMTRGYLGELAFINYLQNNFFIKCVLGHEVGDLEEYLPMDIHSVFEKNGIERKPNINISIKTTKWNGIWLDIPGDQFSHSDVHVLVKVGVGRDHLFAFFKDLSVFKDKVLRYGEEEEFLNSNESKEIYQWLPSFKPIIAYMCGFVLKSSSYSHMSYEGKKGNKNYTITAWNGPITKGDLDKIKFNENIGGDVKFKSIEKFNHDNGYLFNTGNLLWKKNDWEIIAKLI